MKTKNKIKNDICNGMSFLDCEIAILRNAIDEIEEINKLNASNNPELKKLIEIVEDFLKTKHLIVYGGTAINNILPKEDQFYNHDVEMPDYDFYSSNALEDAKELAEIYYKAGFVEVEAKSAQHHGTYKVFVNFIPVADISHMPSDLFRALKKDSIKIDGITYASPNFLRMGMYLELSRPKGDLTRYEKVLKRLALLNKHYPLKSADCNLTEVKENSDIDKEIYETTLNVLIDLGSVFFGGQALLIYSRYMPKFIKKNIKGVPDFDVLAEEPLITAKVLKEKYIAIGVNTDNIRIIKHTGISEIIPEHYEVKVNNVSLVFIYKPLACHSYNEIKQDKKPIKIASIDTMLSFFLAFLYANRKYYDKHRIICMSQYLFIVQEKNRLTNRGVLKRFSPNCMGHQITVEEMRSEKIKYYYLLDRDSKEYEERFLRYRPAHEYYQKLYKKGKKSDKEIEELIRKDMKKDIENNNDIVENVNKDVSKSLNSLKKTLKKRINNVSDISSNAKRNIIKNIDNLTREGVRNGDKDKDIDEIVDDATHRVTIIHKRKTRRRGRH